MGNLCAGPPPAQRAATAPSGGKEAQQSSKPLFGRDPNLNPEDFMVKGKENEFIVRAPGSVAGQQFLIDSCKGCDIYVFDHSAAVTVDDCIDCRIFVGPCESSLFVRDCRDCKVVAIVQQFRCRDLTATDLMLYTQTRPVIEASSGLRIGCLRFGYFSLAGLNPWLNPWDAVHDFSATDQRHWDLLPEDATAADLLRPLPEESSAEVAIDTEGASAVPLTRGTRRLRPKGEAVLACFFDADGPDAAGWQAASRAADGLAGSLVRTKFLRLDKTMAASLFGNDKQRVAAATRKPCVVLEAALDGAEARIQSLLPPAEIKSEGWALVGPQTTSAVATALFEEWGEEVGHSL